MKKSTRSFLSLLVVAMILLLGGNSFLGDKSSPPQLPESAVTDAAVQSTPKLAATNKLQQASSVKNSPITTPQEIASYLFEHGELPDNFITKKEAQALGWDSASNYVSDVAPGKSIGGDRFGNYEKLLPHKDGRTWKECDCHYESGPRNAYRIVYSNDGLIFYSDDHYKTFTEIVQPS